MESLRGQGLADGAAAIVKNTGNAPLSITQVAVTGANASDFRIPALNQANPRNASNWKATAMIWGGPVLALACIYIMAAHLGWL